VPERPEELYARALAAADADRRLALPPLDAWDTFPFDGDLRVRPLLEPVATEPPRSGEDPAACRACNRPDAEFLWTDEHWRVGPLARPSGLPVVVILEPRAHCDLGDLAPELAAELGPLIVRLERAVAAVEGIGRVHVGRFGDGSAHLQWWFMGRPARLPQLLGSFAAIWDDILPPLPEAVWRENLVLVGRALAAGGGTCRVA
jgi:hypothetical protein